MKASFFISISTILYVWLFYLLLLTLLSRFRTYNWRRQEIYPSITVLLTVHNEEALIATRLDNLLSQDYPSELVEVLVASDGSTDKTDEIVASIAEQERRVKLFRADGGGKSVTQNSAINLAAGDIVLLTDANTHFRSDTLKEISKSFADERVGCVSGKLKLNQISGAVSQSQGLYWNFEMALRRMESRIGALHTASGPIMAFRRKLFKPFNPKFGDDCIIPLDIIMQGYAVVHADDTVAYDSFPSSITGEFNARTRMTLRNITCTLSKYELFNPIKYPLVSIAILSHKVFRWLTPFFMLGALFSNLILLNVNRFFFLSGIVQCLFYLLSLLGLLGEKLRVYIPIASQIFSFTLANAGFFLGVLKAATGRYVTSYSNYSLFNNS